jgi:hypothetical protein
MTASAVERKFWRDFAHTLTVTMASALAADDVARRDESLCTRTFEFTLLAATGQQGFVLPREERLTADGTMGLRFEEGPGEIRVLLQLKGFAAIAAFGGRTARLVSLNGAVYYEFRFDSRGAAACTLADDAHVREGLRGLRVAIELEP